LAKVTFIFGLYGSGKTYLSEKMKKQTGHTYLKTYLRTAIAYPPHSMLERWKGPPCQRRNHPDSANPILHCVNLLQYSGL
jgi:adenylate kinase family enzyme